MCRIVQTGLFWVLKGDISSSQLGTIRRRYSYPHPLDPTQTFHTFVEMEDKIGVPTGDRRKLESILGELTIEDRTVCPLFDTPTGEVGMVLRDNQKAALNELQRYFDSGVCTLNLRGVPGVGKSFMLAKLITTLRVKVLIIAHLSSLITQIKGEIEDATGLSVNVLNSKNKSISDINVATSQFISHNPDVWYNIKRGVGLIVVDEAESAASTSTLRIIQKAYAKYRIFISATFSRSVDSRTEALTDVAGHARVTIEAENMLNPSVIQVLCEEVFIPPLNKSWYQKAKGSFYKQRSIYSKVVEIALASVKKERQVLVATDILDMQEGLKLALESKGVKCGVMNGKTKDRDNLLEAYALGDIQVIIGFGVLKAGLSIPRISTIIKVSVPSSRENLEQLIGRGRRRYEGKLGFWFIDLVWTGFKNQSDFYTTKVEQEGWGFSRVTWEDFKHRL